MTPELEKVLKEEHGYLVVREIPNRGVCALKRFLFTIAIIYGIDEIGWTGRWCYDNGFEAMKAFLEWDGVRDPSGNWIKYKGKGGERSRVLSEYDEENQQI